jgi:hypothetical protein
MKTRTTWRRTGGDTHEDMRDQHPGAGEQAGEAVGGIGGTLAGAAIGSAAGPVGTVLGGIAGALGGWWVGEKAGRAAEDMGDHDEYYRSHWDAHRHRDFDYDTARVGYGVGHVAGRNPEYGGRAFDEVEADLRRGWGASNYGYDFDTMLPYVRAGYERTMTSGGHHSRGGPMDSGYIGGGPVRK